MRGPLTIPGELLSCFSGPFSCISGTGGSSPFLACIRAAVRVWVRRERRAVVWPVSWLVRGRAWPGGRTLAWRGRAALARPLWVRPGPPVLPGEGPAPGRWVKNRTTRHLAPAPVDGQRRGGGARSERPVSANHRISPATTAGAAGWPGIRPSTTRDSAAAMRARMARRSGRPWRIRAGSSRSGRMLRRGPGSEPGGVGRRRGGVVAGCSIRSA